MRVPQIPVASFVRIPTVGVVLAALLLLPPAAGQTAERPLPPQQQFLDEVFDKILVWERNPPRPNHRERRITTDFDGDKVSERLEEIYRITWYRKEPVYVLEAKNGKPMSANYIQSQEARKKKAIDDEIAKPSNKEKIQAIYITPLLQRYSYKLVGRESVQDRTAVKVRFDPIPGKFPERKIASKIMENVYGYGWVDENEKELMQAVVDNNGSIHIGWGILANISRLHIHYTRQYLPEQRFWFVRSLKVRAKVRIFLWTSYNRLVESTFYDVNAPDIAGIKYAEPKQ